MAWQKLRRGQKKKCLKAIFEVLRVWLNLHVLGCMPVVGVWTKYKKSL
jgi:hypothetical protein